MNGGFERLDDRGLPADWRPVDYATAGEALVGDDGGQEGERYVILRVTGDYQRAAWCQHVPWDPAARGVTVTAWYRTPGLEEVPGRGAALRLLCRAGPQAEEPLAVQMAHYAAAPT